MIIRGPCDAGGGGAPSRRPQYGVCVPVQDKGWLGQLHQSRAVPLGADLSALRLAVTRPAVDLALDPLPCRVLVERVGRRCHSPRHRKAGGDVALASLGELHPRQPREQSRPKVTGHLDPGDIAGQGGRGHNTADAVGMAQGDPLGDDAAQRVAEDMGGRAVEVIEDGDGVVGHVLGGVGLAALAE